MPDRGIISQYGFLYQRKVFVLYVLENMNIKQRFCFEGKDDVEVSLNDSIYDLDNYSSNCVQVKSGSVNKQCFCKVVGNWLLLQDAECNSYTLFLENDLEFEWKIEEIEDEIISFVKAGKKLKKSAIARKVYEQYKEDIEQNNEQRLLADIRVILEKTELKKCSMDDVDLRLERVFFDNYCTDIVEYEIAKKKRLERFLGYINKQIDDLLKNKKTYSLIFPELHKLLMLVCEEITDHSYKPDVSALKPCFTENARRIVEERNNREVRQLLLVNPREEFAIKGIVDELFYQDFRGVLAEQRYVDISNLETYARDNFDNARFELGEAASPKELYDKTVSKILNDDLLPKGPMYSKGCYIYLTGDEIDKDTQITWGEEHENE